MLATSMTLIPRLGLNGAAIAYSTATGFRAIAFYIAARRYVPAVATP
jgi:O-antigen/teichoic acid export membrane protein